MSIAIVTNIFLLSFLFLSSSVFASFGVSQFQWATAPQQITSEQSVAVLSVNYLLEKEREEELSLRKKVDEALMMFSQFFVEYRENNFFLSPADIDPFYAPMLYIDN